MNRHGAPRRPRKRDNRAAPSTNENARYRASGRSLATRPETAKHLSETRNRRTSGRATRCIEVKKGPRHVRSRRADEEIRTGADDAVPRR